MAMAMLASGLLAAGAPVDAAPAVDEDFVFERLEWDFEDGTSQGWFGRTAADGFGVVTPGADAS